MSLINDALKKAQKQRTGESTPLSAMPGVGGESAARIAQRAKPAGFNSQLIRLGLGVAGVLVLVVGGYFMMRSKPEQPAVNPQVSGLSPQVSSPAGSPPTTQTSSVAAPPASQPSTINSQPSTSATPAAGFILPIVTPPPPTPEPVVVKKPLPAVAKQTAGQTPGLPQQTAVNSQPSTLNSQPAVRPPPPKLDSKAINFIETLRIAGIRASATDSKVLMNDRVFRIGDIVEHELGLKLIGLTANSLTFEDEHGGRYTRQF